MKKLFALILMLFVAGNVYAGQWNKLIPLSTSQKIDFPTQNQANLDATDRVLANYREGLTISYSSASAVSVSSGEVVVSNSAGSLRLMLKNDAATSVDFSSIDTGSEASSTTYYLYAIAATGASETATFKVSVSSTAPTGEVYYKRLGSFYNDASSNIITVSNDNNVYASGYGAWTSKSASVTYQALTDGIVVGYITGDTAGTSTIYGYTDSASAPTTVRVKANYLASALEASSFTMPVKKGDYYKVTCSTNGTFVMFWLPQN